MRLCLLDTGGGCKPVRGDPPNLTYTFLCKGTANIQKETDTVVWFARRFSVSAVLLVSGNMVFYSEVLVVVLVQV